MAEWKKTSNPTECYRVRFKDTYLYTNNFDEYSYAIDRSTEETSGRFRDQLQVIKSISISDSEYIFRIKYEDLNNRVDLDDLIRIFDVFKIERLYQIKYEQNIENEYVNKFVYQDDLKITKINIRSNADEVVLYCSTDISFNTELSNNYVVMVDGKIFCDDYRKSIPNNDVEDTNFYRLLESVSFSTPSDNQNINATINCDISIATTDGRLINGLENIHTFNFNAENWKNNSRIQVFEIINDELVERLDQPITSCSQTDNKITINSTKIRNPIKFQWPVNVKEDEKLYTSHTKLVKINTKVCINQTCTKTGCFKTAGTCQDLSLYQDGKSFMWFIESDKNLNSLKFKDARPYLKSINIIPNELKEDKTISLRATLQFIDEPDNDIIYENGEPTSVNLETKGTFWKKFIARHENIFGQTIEVYDVIEDDVFELNSPNEENKVFIGKIENCDFTGNGVSFKCVDLMKRLEEIDSTVDVDTKLVENLGKIHKVNTYDDANKIYKQKNDIVIVKEFETINFSNIYKVFSSSNGNSRKEKWSIVVYAFDSNNNPLGKGEFEEYIDIPNKKNLDYVNSHFEWDAISGASYYLTMINGSNLAQKTTYSQIPLRGSSVIYRYTTFEIPENAKRIFRINDSNNLVLIPEGYPLQVSNGNNLDASGYVSINNEIIKYKRLSNSTIKVLEREAYSSKNSKGNINDAVKMVFQTSEQHPVDCLKLILKKAKLNEFIDSESFDNAKEFLQKSKNIYSKPIVKSQKLNKLYFDLLTLIDGQSWITEEGKIAIALKDNVEIKHVISDDRNIIDGTVKVKYQSDEKYSRVLFRYLRKDIGKNPYGSDNFSRAVIYVNGNLESQVYNDFQKTKEYSTIWLNSTKISNQNLLKKLISKKLERYSKPRIDVSFATDIKDKNIKIGDYVIIKSDELNMPDGSDYGFHLDIHGSIVSANVFQITKKSISQNRINYTAQYVPELNKSEAMFTLAEELSEVSDGLSETQEFPLDVAVSGLEFLTYYDHQNGKYQTTRSWKKERYNRWDLFEDFITLRWDNMYASEMEFAKLLSGATMPIQSKEIWKSIKSYKIYAIYHTGRNITELPSLSTLLAENNSDLVELVGTVKDEQIESGKDYYEYKVKNLKVGRTVSFIVAASTSNLNEINLRGV